MYNLDLFDDVTITLCDVELWLRCVPRFTDANRANHVQDYIVNYDVVNKIRAAKLDNTFYFLNHSSDHYKQNLSTSTLPLAKGRFKPSPFIPHSLHVARHAQKSRN